MRKPNVDSYDIALKTICLLVVVFLVAPVLMALAPSFYKIAGTYGGTSGLLSLFTDKVWRDPLFNSFLVAVATTVISLSLGIPASLSVRHMFRGKSVLNLLIITPFFVPAIIIGIDLLMFVPIIGLYGSLLSIVLGHCLWALPLAFLTLSAALQGVDPNLEDAARSLGAGPVRVFVEVTAPLIKSAVIASSLFAFIMSFNEFMIAYFLSVARTQTLPIQIWGSLRMALSPVVPAASAVIVILTVIVLAIVYKLVGFRALF